MPEQAWVEVAVGRVADLPPGSLRAVQADGRWYALANVDGTFYALDGSCPHSGGPLGKGRLVDGEIECPWHGWRWNAASGRCAWPGSAWPVARVGVRVDGERVLLRLPAR